MIRKTAAVSQQAIVVAYRNLLAARAAGDGLTIDLAESALNDLLDRLNVTLVTGNKGEEQAA